MQSPQPESSRSYQSASEADAHETPPLEECPPTPAHRDELGFEPYQPMVDWFSPTELVRAGVKVLLSTLFGAYADRREIQALQAAPTVCDYREDSPLWIDYVADLGDGFDATYTVARLLAEETLPLEDGHTTERGRLLVMGGDQVYPSATPDFYNDRLVGPYRAALPCVIPAEDAPHLFSIPGNHDWYDGLTSYTRLFCQQRWIGGWKTQQTRSYFAARLSERWWLLGLDIQLSSDVDLPQLEYFKMVARDHMEPGSLVILCKANPTWVQSASDEKAYDNLAFFEKKVLAPYGHVLKVGLAGDYHMYARYEEQQPEQPLAPKQRFIAGGGGAYTYPTHDLPRELVLPGPASSGNDEPSSEVYSAESKDEDGEAAFSMFPSISESRRLTLSTLFFGAKSWKLSLFFGGFYLFFAWVFHNAAGVSFFEQLVGVPRFVDLVGPFIEAVMLSPSSTLLLLLFWGGLVGYADAEGGRRFALGTFHTILHVVLFLLLLWGLVRLFPAVLTPGLQWGNLGFVVAMILGGGLAAGTLMGIYLMIANIFFGIHGNEVFLGQRLTSYKNVLRFRLDADETLTIYPIGIRKVCHDWTFNKNAPRGTAWFSSETWDRRFSAAAEQEERWYGLIEEPIRLEIPDEETRAATGTRNPEVEETE